MIWSCYIAFLASMMLEERKSVAAAFEYHGFPIVPLFLSNQKLRLLDFAEMSEAAARLNSSRL
jgi:hypothetical protein